MADDTSTTPAKKEAERYEADYLVTNARALLDAPPGVVTGALSLEDRKTHTIEQAKKLIATYLRRPIDVDNEGDDE